MRLIIQSYLGTDECLSANNSGSCTDNQQCSNINRVFECTCLDGYTYDSSDPDTRIGKKMVYKFCT